MRVDGTTKGIPAGTAAMDLSEVGERGWNLLEEDLELPVAVLREDALEHNSRWMRDFLDATGVRLCPHGKTTMAPELFRRQLRDGAWGITVASVRQLRVCRRHGISRILVANQVVREASIRWLLEELERDPGFEACCLVDSLEGVRRMERAAATVGGARPLPLLVELGYEGGRAGCRGVGAALVVARAVREAERLDLRGVEGFEGLLGKGRTPDEARRAVSGYLDGLAEAAERMHGEGLFAEGEVLVTAGGSAWFDVVVDRLSAVELDGRARPVLRSGCYLTHDTGMYEQAIRRLRDRSPRARERGDGLRPALEVWSYVQSRPEPERAILTMGKRDCSYDVDLPAPERVFRPGRDEEPRPLDGRYRIVGLNDQHAYLDLPEASDLRVGDMVGCGISHPCTTFDRWRMLSLVDEAYNVVGAVHTEF